MADGQHAFDFLLGTWKIHNRRLEKPLSGSQEWYEFPATVAVRPVWGGKGNVDEYYAETTPFGPIQGMTVRLYDPSARQWSLYWANSAKGRLEPPVVGELVDGRGEFVDQEMFGGRTILVRYVWSDITADSCRWQQAFSADGGKTWETNWTMELVRVSGP